MRWLLIGLALLSTATQAQGGSPFDCSGADDSALVVEALGGSAAELDQTPQRPEVARILLAATIPGAVTYMSDPSVCEQASAEWGDDPDFLAVGSRLSAYLVTIPDEPPAVVMVSLPLTGIFPTADGGSVIRHAHTKVGLKVQFLDGGMLYWVWF